MRGASLQGESATMSRRPKKAFDCVEMKHVIQKRIRALVAGMTRKEEIAFFREGAEEFEKRIEQAKQDLDQRSPYE